MVNIYYISILKLPKGRHDVCESSRVLISFFGWVGKDGREREREVGEVVKRILRKKLGKKGKNLTGKSVL